MIKRNNGGVDSINRASYGQGSVHVVQEEGPLSEELH
jgi:hypothetical protein